MSAGFEKKQYFFDEWICCERHYDVGGRKMGSEKTFAERHTRINYMIGIVLLILMCLGSVWLIKCVLQLIGDGFINVKSLLKVFVNSTDKVIVVAMITGTVSIIGVVISSVFAKVVDYRFNVKKYLYDKREEPYKQFIEMIYAIMEDAKKCESEKMSEVDTFKMVSEFSKGLTLWGSNRVVKKWLKYRKSSLNGNQHDLLLQMEEIIYEIRRDVGLGHKLKRGDMLSFFINDIENLKI